MLPCQVPEVVSCLLPAVKRLVAQRHWRCAQALSFLCLCSTIGGTLSLITFILVSLLALASLTLRSSCSSLCIISLAIISLAIISLCVISLCNSSLGIGSIVMF